MLYYESENMELKSSFSEWREIIETLGAFANKKGGMVVVGIDDKGEPTEQTIGKNTIEDFVNKIKTNSDPVLYPSINQKTFGPGEVFEIYIPENDNKPVFTFNKSYIRVGKTNQKMSQNEIRELIKRYTLPDFDSRSANVHFNIDTFDTSLLKQLRNEKNPAGKKNLSSVLEKYGMISGNILTNAGYLCFIKQNTLHPNAIVKTARFKGTSMDTFIDMKEFDSNLVRCVDDTLEFIKRHINMEVEITGKAKRTEIWDYPLSALREAIINALVHREYSDPGNIQIRIFDDRLEVWSPGLLPKEFNINNLVLESRSIPRNKNIARIFHDLDIFEGWGSGFQRVVSACERNGNGLPVFTERAGAFVIIFMKRINNISGGVKSGGVKSGGVKSGGVKSGGVNTVMEYIKSNPGKRSTFISKEIEMPKRTVERWLKILKENNKIKFIGTPKTGGYYIVKKDK